MSKEFKVVKIINEYKVVVNAGSRDFITEGQRMEIYAPGISIIDPETKEDLGTLDYIKAKILVDDVFPKMCICINQESETTSIFQPIKFETERLLPLSIDVKEISGGFEGVSKKIRVGDLVRIQE